VRTHSENDTNLTSTRDDALAVRTEGGTRDPTGMPRENGALGTRGGVPQPRRAVSVGRDDQFARQDGRPTPCARLELPDGRVGGPEPPKPDSMRVDDVRVDVTRRKGARIEGINSVEKSVSTPNELVESANVAKVIFCDICGTPMLDKPEKTRQLIAVLKAALPFEVALMPELIADLTRQDKPVSVKPIETVSEISYLGDAGGIVCHIQPEGDDYLVLTSLTHVRVPRTLPFAAAVINYQKHRVKKLRKQQTRSR